MRAKYIRLVAAFIDYMLFLMLGALLFGFAVSCIGGIRKNNDFFDELSLAFDIWLFFMIIVMFMYYACSDYFFKGVTIGKKITGLRIFRNEKKSDIQFSFFHAGIKIIASLIWPVTLIYYMRTQNMFYDKWLNIKTFEMHL